MADEPMTWDQLLATYWPVLAVSFGVSLVMTPLCRWLAMRYKIVDRPDDFLKPHGRPMPYLGGVAIFLGWAAGLAWALCRYATSDPPVALAGGVGMDLTLMAGIAVAGTVIVGIGLLDDIRHLSPVGRLAVTLLLGLLLVSCGLGDDFVSVFARKCGAAFLPESRWVALALSAPVTLFVIVGACNATNVLDGLDGLCAGVLSIVHLGYAGLALYLHTQGHGDPHDLPRVVLALTVLGGALGFLPYNWHPATIFMGDAGSMFLGINTAVLILLLAETTVVKFALAGLVVFTVPVADMSLAMFRRWRTGKPLMQGDRSHFYDQLVDRGWSVRQVAVTAYALAGGYVLLGWTAIVLPTPHVIILYAAAAAATVATVVLTKMVRMEN